MDRVRVSSGSPYEPVIGFSRAAVAGHHVAVAATAHFLMDIPWEVAFVLGAVLGLALLSVVTSSLILLDVSPYWQDVIKGLILLVAQSG